MNNRGYSSIEVISFLCGLCLSFTLNSLRAEQSILKRILDSSATQVHADGSIHRGSMADSFAVREINSFRIIAVSVRKALALRLQPLLDTWPPWKIGRRAEQLLKKHCQSYSASSTWSEESVSLSVSGRSLLGHVARGGRKRAGWFFVRLRFQHCFSFLVGWRAAVSVSRRSVWQCVEKRYSSLWVEKKD